jgi:periplasmic protein CpxP/Spy
MRNSSEPKKSCFGRSERNPLMATILLAALFSVGFAANNAFSQDAQPAPPAQSDQQPGPGMGGHMGHRQMPSVDDQLKHMTKKLKLTDDQQTKLKPILEDQRKQMDQLRADTSMSRQDKFGKMQEIRQSSDTQIKSVLNDDQQKSFDKMRAEQQDRMKQWHQEGNNAPLPASDGGSPNNQ